MRWSLVLLLLSAACTLGSGTVPARCEHLGDRCTLRDGVQGVCAVNDAARCDHPPCLVCTPQH